MKYTFISESSDKTKIVYEFEAISIPDMLEHYEYFLKACSYQIKGPLEIVEEE